MCARVRAHARATWMYSVRTECTHGASLPRGLGWFGRAQWGGSNHITKTSAFACYEATWKQTWEAGDTMSSDLAQTIRTIKKEKKRDSRVRGKREEESWLVLAQLEYSWGRSRPEREIETGYFWACPPPSPRPPPPCPLPRSQSCIIHTPFTIYSHPSQPPQQCPVVQFSSRPLNSWFHVARWRMGDVEMGWILKVSHHAAGCGRKWLHLLLWSPDACSVCHCTVGWTQAAAAGWEVRERAMCRGINMIY